MYTLPSMSTAHKNKNVNKINAAQPILNNLFHLFFFRVLMEKDKSKWRQILS